MKDYGETLTAAAVVLKGELITVGCRAKKKGALKSRPACDKHSCYACKDGRCLVLTEAYDHCPFYKTFPDYSRGMRKSFYRLIALKRTDLIERYQTRFFDISLYKKDVRIPDEALPDPEHYKERIRMQMGDALASCPVCRRPDCFACIDGCCTVLNAAVDSCPFYKTFSGWYVGALRSFAQIVIRKRFDLVEIYRDTLSDIGMFDADIMAAKKKKEELKQYRQETMQILRASDDPDSCAKALKPKESDFGELEKQPDKSSDKNEEDESAQKKNISIAAIPEERDKADDQLKSIREMIDDGEMDAVSAADTLTEVNAACVEIDQEWVKDSPQDQDNFEKLHAEKRLTETNSEARHISVWDVLYRLMPRILPTQRLRRPPESDYTYGTLGAEAMLQFARDYVYALRRQWWEPDNIDNLIEVWQYKAFIGSHWYWQLTNMNPGRLIDRCDDIALAAEMKAIIDENEEKIGAR